MHTINLTDAEWEFLQLELERLREFHASDEWSPGCERDIVLSIYHKLQQA